MARQRHLRNAPIREALIDFRAPAPKPLGSNELVRLQALVGSEYPQHEPILRVELKFGVKQGQPSAESVPTQVGWMFKTADGRQVAQFRSDGFTFNRLPPYTTWEELFPQAYRLWKMHADVVRPVEVGRLAVRFINSLPRFAPTSSFGLTAPPNSPPEVPLPMRSFLTRVVVYDQARASSAVVTQAVEESDRPVVLLDIDAFWEGALAREDSRIGTVLGELRDMKNAIFFASITEETAEFYE